MAGSEFNPVRDLRSATKPPFDSGFRTILEANTDSFTSKEWAFEGLRLVPQSDVATLHSGRADFHVILSGCAEYERSGLGRINLLNRYVAGLR